MTSSLKISIVTDIHCGEDLQFKKGTEALGLLDRFVEHVRQTDPDVVVDLGDRISDTSVEGDRRNLQAVADRFARISTPRFHIVGNHDVVNLSRRDNEHALQVSLKQQVLETGVWRLVFWHPDVTSVGTIGMRAPSVADLDWLEKALPVNGSPAVIFSHLPVSGLPMTGNRYFEFHPDGATYPIHREIRHLAERAGGPIIWFSGHIHWNSLTTIRNVHHVTIQSLTECYPHSNTASGAFADVELTPHSISINVAGRDPIGLRVNMPPMLAETCSPSAPMEQINAIA